jgi:hypothetical protein
MAKRWACTHAAIILETAMDGGFPRHANPEIEEELRKALESVRNELIQRGLHVSDPILTLED